MSTKKWPKNPEKQQDLALAFDEGEYQYELAKGVFSAAMSALYAAEKSGDQEQISDCQDKVTAARQKMNALRYAPVQPKSL